MLASRAHGAPECGAREQGEPMPDRETPADPITRYTLDQQIFRLGFLYDLCRALMGARDLSVISKVFLNTISGYFFPDTAALFRYDEVAGRLRMFDDRLGRTGLRATVLSAEELTFLEGEEAREGIWVKSSALSPAARAFIREQGSWLDEWEIAAFVPIKPASGLWGLAGFGKLKDDSPYNAAALGDLAEAAQMVAEVVESLRRSSAAEAAASPAGLPDAKTLADSPHVPTDAKSLRALYPGLEEIVGESVALARMLRELVRVAPTRISVLILGPTGTGKELAARALHRMSPRTEGPFEVVDCGAIPRELIESELFGHVRGAFTGASRDRRGAFELAHNGTLFLDEIGELPPGAQTRLLRVLQDGQLRRVGDERTIHVSVRVIAATNRDLARMAQEGRFRSDLFYRLSVFTAQMPALAERREDLGPLARHFLGLLAAETGRPEPRLSPALQRRLSEYSFPGNVRELQNILTRLILRTDSGEPSIEDLDEAIAQSSDRTARAVATPLAPEEDADAPGRGDAGKIGPWVVSHLRRHEFNLSQAERALDRIQRSPAGKTAAPVADRASLNYYLQGELLRSFHETGYDVERATRSIAGTTELAPRVRHRLRKLLARIAEGIGSFGEEDASRRAARKLFPKLPAYYNPHVDAAAVAFVRGEWSRPAPESLVSDEDED
jgi:transcriptional regulator with GAF, ATPase, and Fis domain